MICDDCRLRKHCLIRGADESCVYKEIDDINKATKNISNILSDAESDDPEFYQELIEITNLSLTLS